MPLNYFSCKNVGENSETTIQHANWVDKHTKFAVAGNQNVSKNCMLCRCMEGMVIEAESMSISCGADGKWSHSLPRYVVH